MRRDRQSGVMGQLNQQVHFVGTELSSHDIGSGVVMPPLAITLTTSTPRLLITLARWLRAATASVLSAPEPSPVPGSQSPPDQGHELIAGGLLMLAGLVDLDELDRWRIGWERRRRGRQCRTAQPANNSHGADRPRCHPGLTPPLPRA